MEWYYALGRERRGPVSEAEFAALRADGTITADTLVWREGMDEWLPLGQTSDAPEASAGSGGPVDSPTASVAPPAVGDAAESDRSGMSGRASDDRRCCECERTFPADDVIELEGRPVCAACKPQFLQRVREGARLPGNTSWGPFVPTESLKAGFELAKRHFLTLFGGLFVSYLGIMVFIVLMILVVFAAAQVSREVFGVTVALAYTAYFGVVVLIMAGILRMALDIVDTERASFSVLFTQFERMLPLMGTLIIYNVVTTIGFLLLIIPGVYWSLKYCLAPMFVVDRGMGPIRAMKASAEATDGAKLDLLVLGIMLGGVYLAGFLALCVGIVFAIPVMVLSAAHAYRVLSQKVPIDKTAQQA